MDEKQQLEKMLKDPEPNGASGKAEEKLREERKLQKKKEAEGEPKTCFQKILKEVRPSRELVPIKILSFLFFGGMFAVTPFFTLHMQQLGLTVKEIAVIYSVLPLPAVVGPVISGILADWTSNFKAILIINIILTVIFNMAIVYTPVSPPLSASHSVALNMSSFALLKPTCPGLEEGLQEWNCSGSCFDGVDVVEAANSTRLFCHDFDDGDQEPLKRCSIPMPVEHQCSYGVSFSPGEGAVPEHTLRKGSHYYSGEQCTMTCSPIGRTGKLDEAKMSNSLTFWTYFFTRFLSQFFMNSAFTMMDASIMAVVLRVGGDYGKQRLVAMLSMASFPFLASCLAWSADEGGPVDYSPVFYLMSGLLCASCVVAYFTDLEVTTDRDGNSTVFKDMKNLFKRMEVNVFLFIIFLLGANWGFLENYLFVYLKSLSAPTYMLGLTMTFGCLTGVPMLLVSDRIVEALGREMVFFIGFLAYTVRMFGYSIITNPWYCFIFEAMEVFTYQMMWVAAVTYFPILAPTSLLGTLSGVAGAMHYNIGRGGGAFIGGFLIAHIGMLWTFRAFGIASLIFAMGYLALQRLYLNNVMKKKDAAKAAEAAQDVTAPEV